jgi:CheY-like chemotaxis protein
MTLSSLVLTLEDSAEKKASVRALLEADARITVGTALEERWLPVVVETRTAEEGESLARFLRDLPGVSFLDVVMVDFTGGEC